MTDQDGGLQSTEVPHSDPEFQAKYGFCRKDCEECVRLDAIDYESLTVEERRTLALSMAVRALIGELFEEPIPLSPGEETS